MRGKIKASILIVTLWVLSILTLFAVSVTAGLHQRILIAGRIEEHEQLRRNAEAAVQRALLELRLTETRGNFAVLPQRCRDNPEVFKTQVLNRGNFTVSYSADDLMIPGAVYYGFIDEERKINLNHAPVPVLQRLLESKAALPAVPSQRLAAAIVDYCDSDTVVNAGPSEDIVYGGGHDAGFKNAPFECLPELLCVPGMTREVLAKIRPYVTVYGSGWVNINTAPIPVLEILGLDRARIQRLSAFRAGKDGRMGSDDDNVVGDISLYLDRMMKFAPMGPEERNQWHDFLFSGLIGGYSSVVAIQATAVLGNNRRTLEVECVAEPTGRVMFWKETIRAH